MNNKNLLNIIDHREERACDMKCKISLVIMGIIIVGFGCGMLGGCGGIPFDEVSYQGPNWTPEGLIYCQKAVNHYRKWPMGTETVGTDYYYVTMTIEGTQETNLPFNRYPYFSPKGTYAALVNGNKISIIKRSDNAKVYEFTPTTESISELDWGPNEDKLVFLTNRKDLYIVSIDATNLEKLTTADADINWKYGDNIVYAKASSDIYARLTIYDIPKKQEAVFNNSKALEPQISQMNTQEVIYRNKGNIEQVNINDSLGNPKVLFSNFDYAYIRLSPDSKNIVAGKVLDPGIWIIDIDGTNLKQLK